MTMPLVPADEEGNPDENGKFYVRQLLVVSGQRDMAAVKRKLLDEKKRWSWLHAFIKKGDSQAPIVPAGSGKKTVTLPVDRWCELRMGGHPHQVEWHA